MYFLSLQEGSLIQRLTPFFEIDPDTQWTAQKGANFHLMLRVCFARLSVIYPILKEAVANQLACPNSGGYILQVFQVNY